MLVISTMNVPLIENQVSSLMPSARPLQEHYKEKLRDTLPGKEMSIYSAPTKHVITVKGMSTEQLPPD